MGGWGEQVREQARALTRERLKKEGAEGLAGVEEEEGEDKDLTGLIDKLRLHARASFLHAVLFRVLRLRPHARQGALCAVCCVVHDGGRSGVMR